MSLNIDVKLGPQGPKGDIGLAGSTGPAGFAGIQGPQGMEGTTGDVGLQGLQGDPGDSGDSGIEGDPGLPGPKGDQGDQGPKGDQGPANNDTSGFATHFGMTIAPTIPKDALWEEHSDDGTNDIYVSMFNENNVELSKVDITSRNLNAKYVIPAYSTAINAGNPVAFPRYFNFLESIDETRLVLPKDVPLGEMQYFKEVRLKKNNFMYVYFVDIRVNASIVTAGLSMDEPFIESRGSSPIISNIGTKLTFNFPNILDVDSTTYLEIHAFNSQHVQTNLLDKTFQCTLANNKLTWVNSSSNAADITIGYPVANYFTFTDDMLVHISADSNAGPAQYIVNVPGLSNGDIIKMRYWPHGQDVVVETYTVKI